MKKYDEVLSFDIPNDYDVVLGTNDNGEQTYSLNACKKVDSTGQETYTYTTQVFVTEQNIEKNIYN